ncbi:MAG TPA: hypothetical protein VLW49_08655 [Gaiellaceae bacterium]|nr:hypothetical protein [Gaiellaceae bacterium]
MIEAPARPPRPDDVELLIREARARQRRRWLGAAVAVALLAAAALGVDSIAAGRSPSASSAAGSTVAVKTGKACGVRVAWTTILSRSGHVLYREPARRTMGHRVQCSGSSIWVVFFNGVGSSQEAYFGVHSGDGGRTWRPVFAEPYFGLHAPHQLVIGYLGPWTLAGSAAYFIGWCPACGAGTNALWVTKNGGRTFREYEIPELTGYMPAAIRVAGRGVTIRGKQVGRGVRLRKIVTVAAQ